MLFEVAFIAITDCFQRISMDNNHRRILTTLMRITHFWTYRTFSFRLLVFNCLLQCARQLRCRQFCHCCCIGRVNRLQQRTDTGGFQSRNKVKFSKRQEIELSFGAQPWACTAPIDSGTRYVVQDAMVGLYDPLGLLATLQARVAGQSQYAAGDA